MNKRIQMMKQAYDTPQVEVIKMQTENQFLAGSKMDGGHNSGNIGGNMGDAKQNYFEEEDEPVQEYNP